MDPQLASLADVLARTDERLTSTEESSRLWPTGFPLLDDTLSGGFRAGTLALLAGPQGLGKTTFALQVARNVAVSGRSVVYFCYEHDPETLLERLVALEAGELADHEAPSLERIRQSFEGADYAAGTLADRLAATTAGVPALMRVQTYADRLCLHRSTGTRTDLSVITEAVDEVWDATGEPPFVVVDYLQKVKVADAPPYEEERVTIVVERLKDLAIDAGVPVLAVVAADKAGLETGKKMRAQHMRGSTALAYEPDVLLMINDKYDVVARHHLVYDSSNADRFHEWIVLSVEKNRLGRDGIDMEFRKRFEQSRFESDGKRVAERLVDERVFTE